VRWHVPFIRGDDRGMRTARARPGSVGWNIGKSLGFALAFMLVWFAAAPWAIMKLHWAIGDTRLGFPPSRRLALALFIACGAMYVLSALVLAILGRGTPSRFDAPRRLVTTGPYGHVRNPMLLAAQGQALAVALYGGSFLLVVYALLGMAAWAAVIRRDEEQELIRTFGRPYEVYRRGVPMFFPTIKAWHPVDDAPTRTLVVSEEVGAPRGRRRRA
jgi:protein-S-isoprenylcysteine O-methyltransferase Ste14